MAKITINVNAKMIQAAPDTFQTSNIIDDQYINVLNNDMKGVTPTNVISIDTTGFILGDLEIQLDNTIKFTPNGNIGTSRFSYNIADSVSRTSTANVYVTTLDT